MVETPRAKWETAVGDAISPFFGEILQLSLWQEKQELL